MDNTKFTNLLFDIACSAVTCDGHIDEKEIRELKHINRSTTYFKDIDLSKRLDRFLNNFKYNADQTINNILDHTKDVFLNPVEEMLILEIVLRLVYADTKIDEKEIKFIEDVRSCLGLDDEMIIQRFGEIDFLISPKDEILNSNNKKDPIDTKSLENLYFSAEDNKESK
tara:strand:+ start:583 stop:1089 length:507 start_codon:yes stop_codon:yes gene_type:complete